MGMMMGGRTMNRKQRRLAEKQGARLPQDGSLALRQLFARAAQMHQAGRLVEAEQLHRQVLAADPQHADSLHMLGVIAIQNGRLEAAVELTNQAIEINGRVAPYHFNQGSALRELGRLEAAVASFKKALDLKPDYLKPLTNLSRVLWELGRADEAIVSLRKALRLMPDNLQELYNLGFMLQDSRQLDEAAATYRRVIDLQPDFVEAHNNLGNVFRDMGLLDEAAASLSRATEMKPDFAEAHSNLGNILLDLGRAEEAAACCRRALDLQPGLAAAHSNLGNALRNLGRLDEAIACYGKALELQPDFVGALTNLAGAYNMLGDRASAEARLEDALSAYHRATELHPDGVEAWTNLGNALSSIGRLEEAFVVYRKAIDLKPDHLGTRSNFLMGLHSSADCSDSEILEEARRFARQVELPGASPAFSNSSDWRRRLRIGYVSGDFRTHPVGYFLAPILAAHDHDEVEVILYSNHAYADAITKRLKGAADGWRLIAGVSDTEVAKTIRGDGIDILVDLSGHTAFNRLPLFAARLAPVQVTWLGYFGTTGLSSIDYILADCFVVPPGEEDHFSETVRRMPGCYLCYAPPEFDIPTGPFPALADGFVTFGCFNNLSKVTPEVLTAWARVLRRVEGSRMLLKARGLASQDCREAMCGQFAERGIDPTRLTLEGYSSPEEALATYNRVDIALDPFPFGGCTTTAETLWMGVPLVTQAGARWAGRMSQSILASLGLDDWVTDGPDSYVDTACRLAASLPELIDLRADLRRRVETSAFCDGPEFTRGLEAAYREMWGAWCAGHPTTG